KGDNWCSTSHRFHERKAIGLHQRSADKNIRSCKEPCQIAPLANAACKPHVQTVRNRQSTFAESQNNYTIEIWQTRQLLEQPRYIFVCIGQRRATCNDDKCVYWQVQMLSA